MKKAKLILGGVAVLSMCLLAARGAETNFISISVACTGEWAACVSLYTPTNWTERIEAKDHTNAVNDLARAGIICAVLGHNWRDGRAGETGNVMYLDYHPGVYYRTCKVCGKGQSRNDGDWK